MPSDFDTDGRSVGPARERERIWPDRGAIADTRYAAGGGRTPESPQGPLDTPADRLAGLLTADEVAIRLAVPRSWVYAETRAQRIPHVRLGRYYRYAPESIAAFIAGLERGPVPYRKYGPPGSPPGGSPHG